MIMHELSTARFAALLLLQSCYFLSLLTGSPLFKALGAASLLASIFVGTPSAKLHEKVSVGFREVVTSLPWLFIIVVAALALRDYWRKPVLILPLWLATVILACWRRFKEPSSSSEPRNT